VVGIWAVILAALGASAATMAGKTSNDFSIPGTEAQQAIDDLSQRFPQANAGGATARIVFAAPEGKTVADSAVQGAIAQVVQEASQAPQVVRVVDPFTAKSISPDGKYAFAQVSYTVQGQELTEADREALFATAEAARDAGLAVEFGGDALRAGPETGVVEVLGVVIAALVLIITLGSLIAAGLPLLTALVGVGVSVAGMLLVANIADINANSLILALMLGVAVGIDYALFIVSRYRHEALIRKDGAEAAGRAVGTAGSAVVFAGLTVIIALAALTVVGIPMLGSMGLSAAGAVAVAVLVALTLLPALLAIAGRRVVTSKLFGRKAVDPESNTGPVRMGERWARLVVKLRWPVLILSLAGLGVVAIPAADLRLGLPDDGMAAVDTTQRKAYDMLSAGFGPGFNAPLTLVVDTNGKDPQAAIGQVTQAVQSIKDVVYVSPLGVSPDGGTALLAVIPSHGPNDVTTTELVHAIRDQAGQIKASTGTDIAVTGPTALNIDISQTLDNAMVPYLLIVVGLAFLLLMLVFRSILVPLKATLGFLLSVAATFGAVVAVFQWGWLSEVFGVKETGPIMSMLPVLLIGILFGLAMDYQVFLVTRMREEFVHGESAQAAVISGFRHGARVVTAAAVIMVSVFGGFVFSGEPLIQSIGFALAFGVFVDAFIVRMTLIPAVMSLLDRAAWWLPRWLNRLLPNVDVEGEKLALAEEEPLPVQQKEPAGATR
jgi:RND superfamily putative drug exporter